MDSLHGSLPWYWGEMRGGSGSKREKGRREGWKKRSPRLQFSLTLPKVFASKLLSLEYSNVNPRNLENLQYIV